ncbi:MAG: class I SAM-dependent methyltransferase [Vicinamibacteria bacterium]
MLHALIEKLSNYPRFFLFCRGLLEANFSVIRKAIRENLAADPRIRVLDVACGPGAFSDLFSEQSYTGIDINPRYIEYAAKHYRGKFHVQDARRLSFENGDFDEALVYGVLHHLNDEDVTAAARSIRRVLREGGIGLVIEDIPTESRLNLVGHLLHWVENGHYIRPAEEYRRLLSPFFNVEEERLFRSGVCDYYMARLVASPKTPGP